MGAAVRAASSSAFWRWGSRRLVRAIQRLIPEHAGIAAPAGLDAHQIASAVWTVAAPRAAEIDRHRVAERDDLPFGLLDEGRHQMDGPSERVTCHLLPRVEIGRASCRERV